jgi:hypothetical protein
MTHNLVPDKIMRTMFKFIPITMILAAGLSAFAPGRAFADPIDDCNNTWQACWSGCATSVYPPQCAAGCNTAWFNCVNKANNPQGTVVNNWFFDANILQAYVARTNGGITSSMVLGPGSYYLATNGLGIIQPLAMAVGLWNGSNFAAASTVTNVEIFTIPINLLSGYSPSNHYSQAPWFDAGHAIQNTTTGLWELLWTPTNDTASFILARIYDSANGLLFSEAVAMP